MTKKHMAEVKAIFSRFESIRAEIETYYDNNPIEPDPDVDDDDSDEREETRNHNCSLMEDIDSNFQDLEVCDES